jgi:sec-independent protein translocase protein TatA
MFGVGGTEWIFIIIIAIVLIFGAKKIPDLARGLGRATTEYHKAREGARRELDKIKNIQNDNNTIASTNISRDKLESIAGSLGIDFIGKSDDELRDSIQTAISKKSYSY